MVPLFVFVEWRMFVQDDEHDLPTIENRTKHTSTSPATNQPCATAKILPENVSEVTLLLDPSLPTQEESTPSI
jgi:hypothetical protein